MSSSGRFADDGMNPTALEFRLPLGHDLNADDDVQITLGVHILSVDQSTGVIKAVYDPAGTAKRTSSSFVEGLLTENRGLKEENVALRSENAALKSENESLTAKQAWIDLGVSFVRLFKFQSAALGHAFLLLLPLCGVLIPLSSLELTDWTSSAVPSYDAEVFWSVWAALITGGLTLWFVGVHASNDPRYSPTRFGGWRHAICCTLPVQGSVFGIVLLLGIGAPVAVGVDVHFYLLDLLVFVMSILAAVVVGQPAAQALAGRCLPQQRSPEKPVVDASTSRAVVILARGEQTTLAAGNKAPQAKASVHQRAFNYILAASVPLCVIIGCACLRFSFCARVCSVPPSQTSPHHCLQSTDPLAIIPLYSSVLNDAWRLAFCLFGHPILLEICLFWMRGFVRRINPMVIKQWNDGGKQMFYMRAGFVSFAIEAVLVLDRRFLIG